MPTFSKKTKNKNSKLKMHLTTEKCVSVVKTYYKTSCYLGEKEAFRGRFPEKGRPINRKIWKNVKQYEREGTGLNINKGRCCRGE